MRYWLMKSEPGCYSIDDLRKDRRTEWDGVRNYQARNFMRDDMKKGDIAFFYHSNANPPGIAGVATIVKESHIDESAFDKNDKHYDPKSNKEKPLWFLVDIAYKKKFKELITLDEIKNDPHLKGVLVAQRGQRLSVMPVSDKHGKYLLKKGGA